MLLRHTHASGPAAMITLQGESVCAACVYEHVHVFKYTLTASLKPNP